MRIPPLPFWIIRIPVRDPARFMSRLQPLVAPTSSYFKAVKGGYPFVGTIAPSSFRLLSVENGTNTYVAWALGRITAHLEGSSITVTLTLHPTALFLLVAFVTWSFYLNDGISWPLMAGAFVFHTVLYFVGFMPSALAVERRLLGVAAAE